MNIEKQNASLMPASHHMQAQPRQSAVSAPREAAPFVAPVMDTPEDTAGAARDAQANQRRIALAEKMIGANKSLVIEKDANRVGFVYKTIDRVTGEIVRVWPQREVATALQALTDADAKAMMSGMMIDAKA
jgi:uncharacterized FlaG/YvyC family protein